MSLPSGYRQLEYIQSTGNQYVDTGFIPNQDSRIVMDIESLATTTQWIFGARNSGNQATFSMPILSATSVRDDYNAETTQGTVSTVLVRTLIDKNKNISSFGDCTFSHAYGPFNSGYNLYLLTVNSAGTLHSSKFKGKIFSCKIYDNDILVRDFIPCQTTSGEIGLWDDVNSVFYGNDGTGAFISGGYTSLKTGDVLNYAYTGAVQSVTLPKGVYKLEVWGAQGGDANAKYALGGRGGYASGIITFNQKEEIFVYVGQSGPVPASVGISEPAFNGGGYGNMSSTISTARVASGGGASDIRIGTDSLFARVIVAGGGGGSGYYSTSQHCNGGVGGGETGGDGKYYSSSSYAMQGYGGTQIEGGGNGYRTSNNYGSFGQGGNDVTASRAGGGGGGGWYGGGAADGYYAGGGGGSGFVWIGSNAPSGYLLGSEYYLTDASTIAGNASMPSISGGTETGHTGNGYARITAIKVDSLNLPVNIGGTWKDANEAFVNIGGTWKTVEAAFVNIGGTWKELG